MSDFINIHDPLWKKWDALAKERDRAYAQMREAQERYERFTRAATEAQAAYYREHAVREAGGEA